MSLHLAFNIKPEVDLLTLNSKETCTDLILKLPKARKGRGGWWVASIMAQRAEPLLVALASLFRAQLGPGCSVSDSASC